MGSCISKSPKKGKEKEISRTDIYKSGKVPGSESPSIPESPGKKPILNKMASKIKQSPKSNLNSTVEVTNKYKQKNVLQEADEMIQLFNLDKFTEESKTNKNSPCQKFIRNPHMNKTVVVCTPYRNVQRHSKRSKTGVAGRKNLGSPQLVFNLDTLESVKVIGKGTFGKVMLVRNKNNNKLYACKIMKKLQILKSNNLANLKSERKILKQISHPFIIKLINTFQDDEKIYFVFDFYNGGELFFHLQKLRKFDESMVKFYSSEIYLAVSYLHENGIIYRDMKPENVILDHLGHIKLIDFGLARDGIDVNSKCNSFCGTNEYIPPEVVNGNRYNFNFDWWGFGVLIYELLFGIPPFLEKSGNKAMLFNKIKHDEPNFNYLGIKITQEAQDLIKRLLNKDPMKRIKPEEIPSHPFYAGINFEQVYEKKLTPPFRPQIKDKEDLTNFDPLFLNENPLSPVKQIKFNIDPNKFADF